MALPCCLPLIDDQTDSVDARANWAKVCGGALRRRRANSARALCAHTGLASAIALRGEVLWQLAVVVSRMEASPCLPHLQQNCTIQPTPFGSPVEPIGRTAPTPFLDPVLVPRRSPQASILGPILGTQNDPNFGYRNWSFVKH